MLRKAARSPIPPLPLLVSAMLSEIFQELDVSISVYWEGTWRALHSVDRLLNLGVQVGTGRARHLYNQRNLAYARETRAKVCAELFGFSDVYVPVRTRGEVSSILVAGPVLRGGLTSARVAQSWYEMARRHAAVSDPYFARFLEEVLATLTLEAVGFRHFQRLIEAFAELVEGGAASEPLIREIEELNAKLAVARFPERMWDAAHKLTDERTAHVWQTPQVKDPLALVGMRGPPQHALVALLSLRQAETDPVSASLARASFQRAAVGIARQAGNMLVGRLEDQGITLLVDRPPGDRTRTFLFELVRRIQSLAMRFGFRAAVGIADGSGGDSLLARYRSALAAAERAVSVGRSWVLAEPKLAVPALFDLRRELGVRALEEPGVLARRFDRYVEAALVRSGFQLHAVRAHLDAGLERLAEPLFDAGVLDRQSLEELLVETRSGDKSTHDLTTMVASYRRAVSSLVATLQAPTMVGQDRNLTRALAFLRERSPEPLTLARVARVAGFAPRHFARLIKRREGMGFERYLQGLRLEHSKTLLIETTLDIGRVAHRAGFRSRTHFQRIFRERVGTTPLSYRAEEVSTFRKAAHGE
jgi:AraC-like DNA-binding protein